jgi:two-component system copper resistance phosphate regulon response regulator CusR
VRVLLVEDDSALSSVILNGLTEQGIQVGNARTFETGRAEAILGGFDVIVLDVMLPGGSGFDLCRSLREREVGTPVLMLTARDAVDDRVRGLESGADDYLTKPFAFRELVARIHALARRPPTQLPEVVRVADLEVDLRAHRVHRGGREVELTAKEYALLTVLARQRGHVVDRAGITAYVWDENHDPYTNVVEVLVRRLRRKIDDGHAVKLIHTIRGAGYRLSDK